LWTEWNGKYRDTVRDFWRGEERTLAELGSRLTGSSDLYQDDGRRPIASINFVTCHDGFTLRDLVSYNDKHNEANGEDNRDGESYNRSWNCGTEGETDDAAVLALRARQQRNMMATLLLSQGVPMIAHGDEFGRTQGGNNNAYCQDSELAWVHWPEKDDEPGDLLAFTRMLTRMRHEHPVFRRRRFFHGRPVQGTHDDLSDIAWFTPAGEEMTDADWREATAKSLAVFLNGQAISEPDPRGQPICDDSFLLLFNASHEDLAFHIPLNHGAQWTVLVDTAAPDCATREPKDRPTVRAGEQWPVPARAMAVLQRPQG
ncbi:MAG: glycogen debranching enzyme, partial [Streptomycetaceae bacterium]|nr:glycogen debranching enzyme [Streptomycetaceae bacterium]